MHYHDVNVAQRQETLKTRSKASLDDILSIPLRGAAGLSDDDIQRASHGCADNAL